MSKHLQPYNFSLTIPHKGKDLLFVEAHFLLDHDDGYSTEKHANELCQLAKAKAIYWFHEHLEKNNDALILKPSVFGDLSTAFHQIHSTNFVITTVTVSEVTQLAEHGSPLPVQSANPFDQITRELNGKLDLILLFREFSARIRTDHPELWENGCTDGQRLDNALEQIKGQIIGRLDPVRTPLWKK